MGGMDMSRSGTDMVKGLLVCLEDSPGSVSRHQFFLATSQASHQSPGLLQ